VKPAYTHPKETLMPMTMRWITAALLAAGMTLLCLSQPAAAHQGGDAKDFEKNVDTALREIINRGAIIFNKQGDFAGCYRLYEGALVSLRPLLGKYPDLQKNIDRGMQDASALATMHDRAHALRKLLNEIRYTLNPELRPVAKTTLWNRLGGEANVAKVVGEFIRTASADPEVNLTRGGKFKLDEVGVAMLQKSLVVFISHVTGGPYKYSGPDMKEAHKGMGITEKEFAATATHLKLALEKYGAKPGDVDEVLKALAALRPQIVEDKKKIEPSEPPDKKKIELPDPNMAVFSGNVMLKGKPLNYGFVTFVDKDGRRFSANIRPDGRYAFKKGFPPGDYKVLIEDSPTPPAQGEVRQPIPKVFQALQTTTLEIIARKGKEEFNIVLP
jgi:hemoglobin